MIFQLLSSFLHISAATSFNWPNSNHLKPPVADKIEAVRNLHYYDTHGRQRFFRGLNVVYKGSPYVPITDHWDPLESFSREDVQLLSDLNMNIIRLGVEWVAVERIRGQYNQTYINVLKGIVQMCNEKGIYVLLDFHHDLWSEKYCGEGAPDWAALEDSRSQFPKPIYEEYPKDQHGFPSRADCERHNWFNYHGTYALSSAFQALYDNKDGIRDSFAHFWKFVASQFKNDDNVIGYEIINEPFAGDVYRSKKFLLPGIADRSVHEAISQVDTRKLIFFESITWDNFNVGFTQVPGGQDYRNRSVLSYHHYFPLPNFLSFDQTIKRRIGDSKRLGSGLMLTEFDVNTVTVLGKVASPSKIQGYLESCDKHLQSWIGWNYKPLIAKTGPGETLVNSTTGEIRRDWVNIFSRTFAHAVAGYTKEMNFNNSTKVFKLVYTPNSSRVPTEIRIMGRVHYPNGFHVAVRPQNAARISVSPENANTVLLYSQWLHPIEVYVVPKGLREDDWNSHPIQVEADFPQE